MKTNHTPGPWHLGKRAADLAIYGAKGEEICKMLSFFNTAEENVANAQRIVACVNACEGINPDAVPELLAFAQFVANGNVGNLEEMARAAIAKATGN